jgi:hypothetical protein
MRGRLELFGRRPLRGLAQAVPGSAVMLTSLWGKQARTTETTL